MQKVIAEEVFEEILDEAAKILKMSGFVRQGLVFRLLTPATCGIIDFQRSNKSLNEEVIFTINLGVVCGTLLDSGTSGLTKSRIIDAHLRQRVGMLLPGRPDKWWEASADRASVANEIVELLSKLAVPYIQTHSAAESLINLWESGHSPGLTALQRARCLSKLKAAPIKMSRRLVSYHSGQS